MKPLDGGIDKGYDPAAVLQAILAGTQCGSVIFKAMGPLAAGDEFTSRGFLWHKKSATIEINTYNNPAKGVYWNAGDAAVNAITLLHEPGHAFNGLFRAGSSAIIYDANPDGSPNVSAEQHNAEVLAPCNQ